MLIILNKLNGLAADEEIIFRQDLLDKLDFFSVTFQKKVTEASSPSAKNC